MARPFIDPMEANYGLTCVTCQDDEAQRARIIDRATNPNVGDLSEGGCNLTRRQATATAAAHLRKHPGHEISWLAMGRVGATRRD